MIPIILALAFIGILLIAVVAGQPNEFAVSRQIQIAAPAEMVFPHINELRNWEAWNPWMEPNGKMIYDGPPAGVGASYSWSGKKMGAGRNTISESQRNELVRFRLEFQKPMVATNTVDFTFRPEGGNTIVTWTMAGKRNFSGKIFGLFLNCDKMCGSQLDKGLAKIKSLVEARPALAAT